MSITLVGPIQHFHDGAEQRYAVVSQYHNKWVIVEHGYKRWGPGMDLVYENELDPNFVPDEYEDERGWKLINGYHTVYKNEEEYIAECVIPEENLVDGLPNLDWAVACLL